MTTNIDELIARLTSVDATSAHTSSEAAEALRSLKQQNDGLIANVLLFQSRIEELEARLKQADEVESDTMHKLKSDLETERLRLAACGVAALGYFDGCNDEYKSASLEDTLRLYDRCREAEAKLSAIRQAVGILEDAILNSVIQYESDRLQIYTALESVQAILSTTQGGNTP